MYPCTESNPVETGFYYLNSRYYDPVIGRFINADGLVSTGQGVLSNNMFTYCNNNPVNRRDPSGSLSTRTVIPPEALIKTVNITPRQDLVNAESILGKNEIQLRALDQFSFNCGGAGIGKKVWYVPTGYINGEPTITTYWRLFFDLGGRKNVRRLNSIDDEIREDEFRVAIKCGPTDFHLIRQQGKNIWYSKCSDAPGCILDDAYVAGDAWDIRYWDAEVCGIRKIWGTENYYNYETIYIAVRIGWDD